MRMYSAQLMSFRNIHSHTLTDASARIVANDIIDIMTKHAYLPATLIADKGTAFTSTNIAEFAQV